MGKSEVKPFFKPEDVEAIYDVADVSVDRAKFLKDLTDGINAKIYREGKAVTGFKSECELWSSCTDQRDTHRALLINIEAISEPCTHPLADIRVDSEPGDILTKFSCGLCNQRVKATKFESMGDE